VLVTVTVLVGAVAVWRLLDQASAGNGGTPGRSPSPQDAAAPVTASPTPSPSPSPEDIYAAIEGPALNRAVAGDPAYVYVPNGVPGTVEVIDPRTFRIVRTISLGYRSFPEHVTPSWDLRWLYVDTSAANELAVIDPKTGKLARIIHGIEHPYNLYFTPDGSRAIDVAEYFNRLDFLDPKTWKLIKSVPMPCSGPDHLDFSATGTYLMLGCEFDGHVIKVDWRTMKVVGTMNITGLPVDVKLAPDGRDFFVANQGTGGVYVIDPRRMKVLKFIPTGRGAHGMAVSRDTTKLYLSNRPAGTISVIDFRGRKVVATWHVGGSPDMLQVSPDGSQLWFSNRYGTTVTVLSTSNGHVIKTITVGGDPHGLTYFPQPGRYSLGHNGVYR
jgi:YVTN family beta-propeller protein